MMDLEITYKGDWSKTASWLNIIKYTRGLMICHQAGKEGVKALQEATPKKTGLTARCWYYEVEEDKDGFKITWSNSNVENGSNIALLLNYGHGTRNGGYVEGLDYIHPALKDIFNGIAEKTYLQLIGGVVSNVFN